MYRYITQKNWWNMKINLLNYNNPYYSGNIMVTKDPQAFRERNYAEMCDKKNTRGYNVNFSGSPAQETSEAAAKVLKKTFGEKILSSKTFGKLLDYAEANPIPCNALFSLVLAGMLRPATIMALPDKDGKNKKDKLNAAAHAVASGVIGFIFSSVVMKPFDDSMKKVKENPAKFLGKGAQKYLGDLKAKGLTKTPVFRNVEKLMKIGPDIIIGIPRSIITIALIPPILKYVFGIDPKKDAKKAKPQEIKDNANNIQIANASLNSPAFKEVKGGV